ncbi:reverse transcriptase [Tanacetum coccineum]|uniref:Reverse transcriptase n=1 Tax=Tanacetum coccineum TaxID=301880 RepID=A0ABQ5ISR3_9ASTR
MATQANKHRIDKHFDVGEYVYLRLHDYRQVSLAWREGQKLTKRYYGPYKIIEKIGEVAHRLQFPETARIHPVFHVSLLRDCIGDHQPSVEVPLWHTDHLHISTPEVVLDRKTTQMNKVKVLIKWLGHDISEATWEDEEQIRFQFPEFPLNLEDEVISHEGGNDRSITGHISPTTVQRPKRQSKRPARYSD